MITFKLEGQKIVSEALENIGLSMQDKKKLEKDVLRPAAKIVVKVMRSKAPKLKGNRSFDVYRTAKLKKGMRAPKGMGQVYARIKSGQLRKSIWYFNTPSTKRYPALNIGPRYKKGVWAKPEKGGWHMHFVQAGYRGNNKVAPNTFVMDSFIATSKGVGNLMKKNTMRMLKKMVKVEGRGYFKIAA